MGLSIESRGGVMDSGVREEVGSKLERLFRYNNNKNSHNSNTNKNQKLSSNSMINKQKSVTINITHQPSLHHQP